MMKLCIPVSPYEAGGSRTFLQQWRAWLSTRGIAWTDDLHAQYDVLFVNAWQTPYPAVYAAKKRLPALRVVQRVDGAGKDYGRTDGADAVQHAVSSVADLVIFQSQYSRQSTLEKHRVVLRDGVIIYNPVDSAHFAPLGEKLANLPTDKPRLITVAWSPNRRKGSWRIPLLARANPDLTFIFVGQSPFLSDPPPNVIHLGKMNRDELARALRSADVFLNLSENDPCPNIVLEAMACGLPVLFAPSGGTPELVGEVGGLPFAHDAEFRPQFDRILADLSSYSQAARARAVADFDHEHIFSAYWGAIQTAQRQPLPPRWRHVFSQMQMGRVWVWDKIINYRDWLPHG